MSDPSRVRLKGPLTPFASGFAEVLSGEGYKRESVCSQLRLLAHLSRWMVDEQMGGPDLSDGVVERFLAARRAAGYTLLLSPKALAPLMGYLRGLGVTP